MSLPPKSPLPSGQIITFYSYKGGTGRSMALANVAWILASNGKRVLAVDWDLEAPGLHRYFSPFLVDRNLTSSEGVIDFVIDYATEAMTPAQEGEVVPDDWYVEHADLPRYAASLEWEGRELPGGGTLDFVSAGRQGPSFSTRVNTFDWQGFYDRHGGGVFLEAAKAKMREEYDYILLDSRTGVSDTSGICTVQMPDILVVCFTLNNQSIEGASAIASSVRAQRAGTDLRVFPVPMRIEMSEKEKLEARREYAHRRFALCPSHLRDREREEYWDAVEMPYIPYYAYEEVLAAFGDRPGSTTSLLGAAERLTSYLTRGEVQRLVPVAETVRQEILAAYARRPSDEVPEDERSRTAERAFSSLGGDQQLLARRLFSRLVRLEGGEKTTRVRIPLGELDPGLLPLVQVFAGVGTLALEAEPGRPEQSAQLADEALAERWPRLRAWIDEDREFLLWRQSLAVQAAEWEAGGKDRGSLLRGRALRQAWARLKERGADLSARERDYIVTGDRARNRRMIAAVAISLVSVVLVVLAISGIVTWQRDQRQKRATAAVAAGDSLLAEGKFDEAVSLYDKAIETEPTEYAPYLKRAEAYRQKGDLEHALADLDTVMASGSGSGVDAALAKADILSARGEYKAAIAALSPYDWWYTANRKLASLYDLTGDTQAALEQYNKLIAAGENPLGTKPEDSDYFNRGLLYLKKQDTKSAAADFQHVFANGTEDKARIAAKAQLEKLGIPAVVPVPEKPRVALQYQNPADAQGADRVRAALKDAFDVDEPQLKPNAKTAGDVRYFFTDDSAKAEEVRKIVENSLAQQGILVSLPTLFRDAKQFPGARRGLIEVWLPPLEETAAAAAPGR